MRSDKVSSAFPDQAMTLFSAGIFPPSLRSAVSSPARTTCDAANEAVELAWLAWPFRFANLSHAQTSPLSLP